MDKPHPTPNETPHRKKLAKRTKVALLLIIAPTLMIAFALFSFSILNLIFNPTFWPTPDTEAVTNTPLGITILNVLFFAIGGAGIVAWLPGIIIGAVLLAKKPTNN